MLQRRRCRPHTPGHELPVVDAPRSGHPQQCVCFRHFRCLMTSLAKYSKKVKILYLFPDTNVFLQCKPLEEVPWSAFGDWDRIEVLLTRAVQTEIDALKGNCNGRQASRARSASSRIRELLQAEGECLPLRTQPVVQLCLRHDLRRDESASGDLNYEERDDQLVGTALGFQKSNPAAAVCLLTNDTGPMASAKAVGLKYREIPEEWFLPPEADDSEKRERVLKSEIARYKSLEPSFVVKLSRTEKTSLTMFRPLSTLELDKLLARLAASFPLCTEFGPTEAQERMTDGYAASALFGQTKEVFHPATADEIEEYREAHAKWERACTEKLSNLPAILHKSLAWPQITVQIENVGSRPADDTLVVLDVQGNLPLRPPEHQEDDEKEQNDYQEKLRLSPAPSAPKGKWKRIDLFSVSRSIADLLIRPERSWLSDGLLRPLLHNVAHQRDPNALYFKEGQRGLPSKHIEYECAQWRHAQSSEDFEFDVLCPMEPGTYSALVIVEVHAANLTRPEVARLPIELSVEEVSCFEVAEKMVAALGA